MTLKKKIAVLAFSIIISVLLMGFFLLRHSYIRLDKQISQIGLSFIQRAASEINFFLDRYEITTIEMRDSLSMLAEKHAFSNNRASQDYEVPIIENYLYRMYQSVSTKGVLNVFLVMSDNGWLLDSRNWPGGYQKDFRDSTWYKEARQQAGVSFSKPYFDVITNQVAFNVLVDVPGADGKSLGLLGLVVRMDDMRELLMSQHFAAPGEGVHIFLHSNGDLLSSLPGKTEKMWDMRSDYASYRFPENITVPSSYVPESLAAVGKTMIGGNVGYQDLHMDGQDWRVFFSPTRIDLVIGYLYPKSFLYAQRNQMFLFSLFTTFSTLLLIFLIFIPITKDLQRIINRVRRASNQITEFFSHSIFSNSSALAESAAEVGSNRIENLSLPLTLLHEEIQDQIMQAKILEFREILGGISSALRVIHLQQGDIVNYAQEILSVNKNINELNRQLTKRELVWANLLEITQSISITTNFKSVLEQVADAIRIMTDAYGVEIVFMSDNKFSVLTLSGYLDEPEQRNTSPAIKNLLLMRAAQSRTPQWIEDLASEPEYANSATRAVSEIELPLMHGGEVVGIMIISFNRKCPYNADLLTTLQPMATSLAGYLAAWKAHREIRASYEYLIDKFQEVANLYHHETAAHLERVSQFSAMAAAWMGCTQQEQEDIMVFSRVHDLGKIRVPLEILMKPAPLDAEEREIMKMHTVWGAELIGNAKWLKIACNICLTHHERWDGTGYPNRISGTDIPLEGRVVNLADIYDALRSKRSYKNALTHDDVVKIILEGDGRTLPEHFDPALLLFFRNSHHEIERIYEEINER